MTEKEQKSKAINIFAILGFAILLLVAVWSTIQVVKFVPKMFSGGGIDLSSEQTSSSDEIKINLEKFNVNSGDAIDVEWEFTKPSEGVISFSYECKSGFHFRLQDETVLPCNSPYTIPDSGNAITLVPISDSNRYTDVSFAITFTSASGENIRAMESITVTNEDITGSPNTLPTSSESENKNTYSTEPTNQIASPVAARTVTPTPVRYVTIPTTPYSNPNGIADLKLNIISVGALNPYTGVFIPKGTVHTRETAAVKFEVENIGDKASGSWTYSAELPTYPHYIYASKAQQSLTPGSTATVIVTFDKQVRGYNTVSIHVDAYNAIPERNEMNNRDARNISVY